MGYAELADGIVAVHVAYVAFVVIGLLLILLGVILRWQWVRNFWFRLAHLFAIAIVALESSVAFECPLFTLENKLRGWAGQEVEAESFLAEMLHSLILHMWPQWVFNVINITFALLVLSTFVLAPPRWPRLFRQRIRTDPGQNLRPEQPQVRSAQ